VVDRATKIFWGLVTGLSAASGFFAYDTIRLRGALAQATATVATGDVVSLVSVFDGDSLVVRNPTGEDVSLRIVGIKALETSQGKDAVAHYATAARAALEKSLENHAIRVLAGTPPKDRHGRSLATLFVEDEDVALRLVKEGHVLVYTAYPFPMMQRYLDEQARARADRKGFWAEPAASSRADALLKLWRREAP